MAMDLEAEETQAHTKERNHQEDSIDFVEHLLINRSHVRRELFLVSRRILVGTLLCNF